MMSTCLVQIDGYDPVTAAAVTLYASGIDDDRVCHLNSQTWWPAIASLPALRYDLFDGDFSGRITTPQTSFALAIEPWPNFARFMLADARVRLWTGEPGDAWASWTLRFDGRCQAQPAVKDGIASISIAVDDRWLDKPLLSTYAGTTGQEGEAALKGRVKPLALGAPRYVPGELIDSVNTVLQLSSYGAIEGIEYALERLARFGAAIADHASYTALVAAAIPAGQWATCKAAGLVRHGAPPAGRLSYHVQGDKAGPDGWARLPGKVIRRIALIAGGAGKIDDASLNSLDTARPWTISLYQDQQTTARELIQRIAASVNAVAGVDWLGQLFVVPVGFGAPSLTLDATGAALPPVASVEQLEIAAPFWKLAIGAEPAWSVHALSDVAFTALLVDRGRYVASETYREGHVADLADGSRWLYINATPTSGNAPPSSGTSNSWWVQLSPPASLGSLSGSVDFATQVGNRPSNLAALNGTESINNALIGLGQNCIANSDFSHTNDLTYGWTPGWNGTVTGGTPARGVNYSPDWSGTLNVAWTACQFTPPAGQVCDSHTNLPNTDGSTIKNLQRWALAVQDGDRIFASCLLARHRCNAYLNLEYYDGAGNYLSEVQSAAGGRSSGGGQGNPANFDRVGEFWDVPNGTRYVVMRIRMGTTGVNSPYIFYTQMMLCKVAPGQQGWPPYTSGPADRSATLGATWGSNLTGRPNNLAALAGTEGINNANISIGANGAIAGGGGGQVTLPGLGGGPWASYNGVQPGTIVQIQQNLFPYPSGTWDGRTPAQLGWVGADYSGYGFTTLYIGHTSWTGGGYYQMFRNSGSAVTVFPFFDTPWNDGGGWYVGISLSGYTSGSSAQFLPYGEFIDSAKSAVLGSFSLTYNSQTDRWEGVGVTPVGTAYIRAVVRSTFPATSSYQDLTFWGIKVERSQNGQVTRYSDPADLLSRPGGLVRLGDGRNMPAVFTAGGRYYFNQSPTYSASAGSPASATISLPAGTLRLGDTTVGYNAMSVGVTGSGGTSATYNLYINDPHYFGGSQTLVATTSNLVPYEGNGRIYLGQIAVTFPASGTSSGGGTGGGGGGYGCVWEDAWVRTRRGYVRARDVLIGDQVLVLDDGTMETVRWECVTNNRIMPREGWEIRSEDGEAVLHLSSETPLTLRDGSAIFPCQLTGHELPVMIGGNFGWRRCYAQPLGKEINVALISCGSQTYAAGNEQGAMIFTHNVTNAKP